MPSLKTLCVVDTCSLVYLSDIEVARKPLLDWLWEEFDVTYSSTVWDEIKRHMEKMGKDGKKLRRRGEKNIWENSRISVYERRLFLSSSIPFEVTINTETKCIKCNQMIYKTYPRVIDVETNEDQGERHNCCVALDAILSGKYEKIVFLTDDIKAIERFVQPVFSNLNLGVIWTSHDFLVHLFLRHRKRITAEQINDALRDLSANFSNIKAPSITRRFATAVKRIAHIEKVASQL